MLYTCNKTERPPKPNKKAVKIRFKESFLQRVDILKNIPISEVQNIVENIELNEYMNNL